MRNWVNLPMYCSCYCTNVGVGLLTGVGPTQVGLLTGVGPTNLGLLIGVGTSTWVEPLIGVAPSI